MKKEQKNSIYSRGFFGKNEFWSGFLEVFGAGWGQIYKGFWRFGAYFGVFFQFFEFFEKKVNFFVFFNQKKQL